MIIGYDTVGYVLACLITLTAIILNPRLIIYAFIILTAFQHFFYELTFSIGNTNVYADDIILTLYCCYACYLVFMKIIKKDKILDTKQNANTLLVLVFLYIFLHISYVLIGLYCGIAVNSVIRRFASYSGFLFFFCPFLFFKDQNKIKNLLIFLVVISIFVFLKQIIWFTKSAEWQYDLTSSGTIRLGANGISLIACALFSLLVFKYEWKYYVLTVIPILSLILVGHRSAFLALGVSLALFFTFTKKINETILFVYLTSLLIFVGFIGIEIYTGRNFFNESIERGSDTFNFENPTSADRIKKIKNNFYIFKKKPIIGIGYDYEILEDLFKTSPSIINSEDYIDSAVKDVLAPHNFVARSLSHTGIIGTILILSIIIMVLNRCFSLTHSSGIYRSYGVFIMCSIIFFIVFALMNTIFMKEGWVFWFICGASLFYGENNEIVVLKTKIHKSIIYAHGHK